MAETLTLDVDGKDVTFTDPGKARAAGRRWRRMAAEIDTAGAPPEATLKMHELRARAKAAEDWARRNEDQTLRNSPPGSHPPQEDQAATKPAGQPTSPSPRGQAGRRAARTLTQAGIRKGRQKASGARQTARTATRKYEAAGGAPVATSVGELALYFFGSIVLLVLLEDVLTKKGSAGFAGATGTIAKLAHRLIAPIPLIAAAGAAASSGSGGSGGNTSGTSGETTPAAPNQLVIDSQRKAASGQ